MSESLKPCPFCGGAATLQKSKHKAPWFQVTCNEENNCHMAPLVEYPVEEDAVKAWNTRAPAGEEAEA